MYSDSLFNIVKGSGFFFVSLKSISKKKNSIKKKKKMVNDVKNKVKCILLFFIY